MELTNKKFMYSVSNSDETYSLTGTVTINANSQIEHFNGGISKTSGIYGNFYYSEDSSNNININISNLPSEVLLEAEQFILTTITEIKNDNK